MWACTMTLNNLLFSSNIVPIFYLKNNRMIGTLTNTLFVRIALNENKKLIYKGNIFFVFAKHLDEKVKGCESHRCSKYPDVM